MAKLVDYEHKLSSRPASCTCRDHDLLAIATTTTNDFVLSLLFGLAAEPAPIFFRDGICVTATSGWRSEPRFDQRVASQEDRVRKITITVAALALVALTASFAPYPGSGSP